MSVPVLELMTQLKHLPGKHDQKSHGRGSGSSAGSGKYVLMFEESIRHLDYEYAGIYKDGKLVFSKPGQATEVEFDGDEMAKMKGAVVTHNHPARAGDVVLPDGGSFSKSDLILMETVEAAEIRAVSAKYQYSAKPKISGGGLSPERRAAILARAYDNAFVYARADGNRLHWRGKITEAEFPAEVTHLTLQRMAAEGFLGYERKAY